MSDEVYDPEGEHCKRCGRRYGLWSTKTDELYAEVTDLPLDPTGMPGLYCPTCFDIMARQKEITLFWACAKDDFPCDVPNEVEMLRKIRKEYNEVLSILKEIAPQGNNWAAEKCEDPVFLAHFICEGVKLAKEERILEAQVLRKEICQTCANLNFSDGDGAEEGGQCRLTSAPMLNGDTCLGGWAAK
jgi:hypothetical protein